MRAAQDGEVRFEGRSIVRGARDGGLVAHAGLVGQLGLVAFVLLALADDGRVDGDYKRLVAEVARVLDDGGGLGLVARDVELEEERAACALGV